MRARYIHTVPCDCCAVPVDSIRSCRASQSLNQSSHLPVKRSTPLCCCRAMTVHAINSLPGRTTRSFDDAAGPTGLQTCWRRGSSRIRQLKNCRVRDPIFSLYNSLILDNPGCVECSLQPCASESRIRPFRLQIPGRWPTNRSPRPAPGFDARWCSPSGRRRSFASDGKLATRHLEPVMKLTPSE